jgi:hypothetical protein
MKSFAILASFVVALLIIDKCIANTTPAEELTTQTLSMGGGIQTSGGGIQTSGGGIQTSEVIGVTGGTQGAGQTLPSGGVGGTGSTEVAGQYNTSTSQPENNSGGQSQPTTVSAASRQLSICSLVLASCVVLVKLL